MLLNNVKLVLPVAGFIHIGFAAPAAPVWNNNEKCKEYLKTMKDAKLVGDLFSRPMAVPPLTTNPTAWIDVMLEYGKNFCLHCAHPHTVVKEPSYEQEVGKLFNAVAPYVGAWEDFETLGNHMQHLCLASKKGNGPGSLEA